MKNTTLTVIFNTEKLDALQFHMNKKEETYRKNSMTQCKSSMRNMFRRQLVNIWMTRYHASLRQENDHAVRLVRLWILRIFNKKIPSHKT